MRAVLWLAVVVPLAAALAAVRNPLGYGPRAVVRAAAVGTAGLWLAVTATQPVDAGALAASGGTGPAAAGAALLVAALTRPAGRLAAAGVGVSLAAVTGGIAASAAAGDVRPALLGLAAAALLAAATVRSQREGHLVPSAGALVGVALAVAGASRLADAPVGFALDAAELPRASAHLLVGGLSLVALAAAARPRTALAPLLPAALVLAVPLAATVPAADTVAIAAASVGAVAAWLPASRGRRHPGDGLHGLALWPVAVAALGVLPAAWLLGGAVVLAAVSIHAATAAAAVPAAAVLAGALAGRDEPVVLVVALLAAATVGGLARGADRAGAAPVGGVPGRAAVRGPRLATVPAAGLALWLLLAPGSWGWTGGAAPDAWGETLGLAAAVGAGALLVAGTTGRLVLPAGAAPLLDVPDPAPGPADPRLARLAALAGALALGAALASLLASSARAA